ncbi:MAG: hypothetical protein JW934_20460 [Anaerolineae bacterium]|nr:hypothetical protein [Anaerolineae bacterium]
MEHTLTLHLPEDIYESLVQAAGETGQSFEGLAIQWLKDAAYYMAHDPFEKFIGALHTQQSDWADRHDRYIGEAQADVTYDTNSEDQAGE